MQATDYDIERDDEGRIVAITFYDDDGNDWRVEGDPDLFTQLEVDL